MTEEHAAAPRLRDGVRAALPLAPSPILFGLAFGYIMLAEVVNAEHGLGRLLMDSQRRSIPQHVILILLIVSLLAYGIDRLLLWFQRGLFPYRTVDA